MTKTRAIVLLIWTVLELLICITIVLIFSYPQKLTIDEKIAEATGPRFAENWSISIGWNQMICSMPAKYQGGGFSQYKKVKLCEVDYGISAEERKACACWEDPWLKVVTGVISFTIFVTVVDFVVALCMCIVNKRSFGYEVSMGIVWCVIGIAWIICVILCSLMFDTEWPYKYRTGVFVYRVPTMYYIGLSFVCAMVVMSFMHIWRFFENGLPENPAVTPPSVVFVQVPPSPQVYLQPSPVMYVQPSPLVYAPPSPHGYDARVTPPMGTPQQMPTTGKSTGPQDRPATYSPPSGRSKVSEKGRLSSGQPSSKEAKASFLDIITEPELELNFSLPNYSIDTVDLILHNPNVNYVLAFKISVTYPNDFLLQPESGIIDAGSKCTVRLTKKAGNVSQRNDKAVLTYTQLPQGSREVSDKAFENKSFCKEKELVILRPVF